MVAVRVSSHTQNGSAVAQHPHVKWQVCLHMESSSNATVSTCSLNVEAPAFDRMLDLKREGIGEREEDGGCSTQSTRAAGCYNNSTLVVPSLCLSSPSLSDHPLIVCSLLSLGALRLPIELPISSSSLPHTHLPASSSSSSSWSCFS